MVTLDHASNFVQATFMKHKSTAGKAIMDVIHFFETQTGNKVKHVKTDNALEFTTVELEEFLRGKGIIHGLSVPYCPQLNGRVERQNRRIKELANTIMIQSGLPKMLWAEACMFVVHILNRTVNHANPIVTPYEIIMKNKPTLSHVRMFGSITFLKSPTGKKEIPHHQLKGVLVGFAAGNNYRVYCQSLKKIIVSHDCTFHENFITYVPVSHHEPFVPPIFPELEAKAEPQSSGEEAAGGDPQFEESFNDYDDNDIFEDASQAQPATPSTSSTASPVNSPPKTTQVEMSAPFGQLTVENIPEGFEVEVQVPGDRRQRKSGLRAKDKMKQTVHFQYHAAVIPRNYKEAVSGPDREFWLESIKDELNSLEENETWEIISNRPDIRTLKTKWVFVIKDDPLSDTPRYKSRLVPMGFTQIPGVDFFETFANVARMETIRIVLTIAAKMDMFIRSVDVKTAFLQGELEEELYIDIPEGIRQQPGKVCKLLRPLYGIKQGPACWEKRLTTFLKSMDFKASEYDPSLFIRLDQEMTYIVCYVDDLLLVSTKKSVLDDTIKKLGKEFKIKETPINKFVGMEILKLPDGSIFLHNKKMAQKILTQYRMNECKPQSTPIQPGTDYPIVEECDDKIPFKQAVGSLLYIARTCRPDLAFSVSELAQFSQAFGPDHWNIIKQVLKYLQGTKNVGLVINAKDKNIILTGYCDASYANCKRTRKSKTGVVFFIGDTAVVWQSSRQGVIAQSSTEAEVMAAAEAANMAIFLRRLLAELGFPQDDATLLLVDSISAIAIAHNSTLLRKTKHMDIRYLVIRNYIKNKEIVVEHVPSAEQRADILTKSLCAGPHKTQCDFLNLVDMDELETMDEQPVHASFYTEFQCKGGNGNEEHKFSLLSDVVDEIKEEQEAEQPTAKLTRSSFWKHCTGLLKMLLLLFLFKTGTCFQTVNKIPVFWRQSKIPVVSGYMQYDLQIVLLNPCTLLNTANLPADLLAQADKQCQQSYEKDFLQSLSRMCPHGKKPKQTDHHIEKRLVDIVIGGLILVVIAIVGVGIGVAAYLKADSNADRIEELENGYTKVMTNVENLEKRYADIAEIVTDVVGRFNETVLFINDLNHNFSDHRHHSVNIAYSVANVVTRIGLGVSILHETTREWNQGKVHMQFLDYLNVTLPCGGQCDFLHARAEWCDFDHLRDELWMSIDIPIINENFALMDAEPFTLMKRTGNETCRIDYQGPAQAIIGNNTDCIHPLINSKPFTSEILVYPMDKCQQDDGNVKRMQPFAVTQCEPTRNQDYLKFIQLKREGDQLFVYCPLSNITINNKVEACPNSVFVLPLNSKFKINNIRYNVSHVKLKVRETWAPFNTMRTNWYLFDNEEVTNLLLPGTELQNLKDEPAFVQMPTLHHETHYLFWTLIAVLAFGSLIIIFFLVRSCQKPKEYGPIVVRAVPSPSTPGNQPQEDQQLVSGTTT